MKRVKLFQQLNLTINRFRFGVSIAALFCLGFTSACNNINSKIKGSTSAINQANPYLSTSAGSFVLQSIVPDQASPGTVLDMVGQNNEFENYCNLGTCFCEYTFTQAGIGTQTISEQNSYKESNLIRCPNGVPSGVSDFSVRVTVSTTTTASPAVTSSTPTNIIYASNPLSGSFANGALAGSGAYMDLTSAKSYIPVQRFQCRKREFIPNPMNTSMIDPFQSQNPSIIYPFNYYTTNLASSLLNQQSAGQSWECTLTATQDHSVQWWANPNVFSMANCTDSFCSGDGSLIYPQTSLSSGKIPVTNPAATGKRRSAFYLAPQSYGVFGVAVKAAISPFSYIASNYAIIGYGAKPIANATGGSSCPNIELPPKSSWVKLWNFRATDITASKMVKSSTSILNTTIACDTTHSDDSTHATTASEMFPSCERQDPNSSVFGVPLDDGGVTTGSPTKMASRVAYFTNSPRSSACYNFGNSVGGKNLLSDIPWTYNANYGGADVWIPSAYKFDDTISQSAMSGLPWNEYANASSWAYAPMAGVSPYDQWLKADGVTYAVPSATPMDYSSQLTTALIAPTGDNYSDQIFVVTDPNVNDTDMRNGSSSVQEYVPRTFRARADCNGTTPCDPVNTGKTPINWGISTTEIGTNAGSDVYPLCVLQFYD